MFPEFNSRVFSSGLAVTRLGMILAGGVNVVCVSQNGPGILIVQLLALLLRGMLELMSLELCYGILSVFRGVSIERFLTEGDTSDWEFREAAIACVVGE